MSNMDQQDFERLQQAAGPVGTDMARSIDENLRKAIGNFPAPPAQRAAIARITAAKLNEFADELDT
jgi:hypothetical protein